MLMLILSYFCTDVKGVPGHFSCVCSVVEKPHGLQNDT